MILKLLQNNHFVRTFLSWSTRLVNSLDNIFTIRYGMCFLQYANCFSKMDDQFSLTLHVCQFASTDMALRLKKSDDVDFSVDRASTAAFCAPSRPSPIRPTFGSGYCSTSAGKTLSSSSVAVRTDGCSSEGFRHCWRPRKKSRSVYVCSVY